MTQSCMACGAVYDPATVGDSCPNCGLDLTSHSAPTVALSPHSPPPAPPTPAVLQPLPEIPQIEVMELLGEGGMGAVYKARQTHLDRIVALKVMRVDLAKSPGVVERFEREAKALAKLNHPNIVTLHDFGRQGDQCYFVMEYVEGVNVRQAIRSGDMTLPQMIAIVCSVCDALQYAHDRGIIHRDIKPENVLLDKNGHVKIADFGLAQIAEDNAASLRLTSSGQIMGTLHYMAPEQIERPTGVDHRVDIYALGVLLYEMLTHELPIGNFQLPSTMGTMDKRLDTVVLQALDKDPSKRYQTASALHAELTRISSSSGDANDVEDDSRFKRTRWVAWGCLVLAALSLYAGVGADGIFEGLPVFLAALVGGFALFGAIRRLKLSADPEKLKTIARNFRASRSRMMTVGAILSLIGLAFQPIEFTVFYIFQCVAIAFWATVAVSHFGLITARRHLAESESSSLHQSRQSWK